MGWNPLEEIRKEADDTYSNIKGSVNDAVGNVKGSINDVFNNAKGSVNDAYNSAKSSVTDFQEELKARWAKRAASGGILSALALAPLDTAFANNRRIQVRVAESIGLGPKPPDAAPAAAPVMPTMPTIDSEAVALARKRQMASMRNRGGRSSTILTEGSSVMGS